MLRRLTLTAVIGFTAFAAQANAQSEEAAVDAAIECLSIDAAEERLACLEAAATTLKRTRIIREEEIIADEKRERDNFGLAGGAENEEARSASTRSADEVDEFGAEAVAEKRKERDNKRLNKINAKIVEVRVNNLGKVTLSLDNGQVWRQLNSDDKRVLFRDDNTLYTATVKRSLMGNYMLKVNELKRTIRVRRIK